jgi:hypothetical protein
MATTTNLDKKTQITIHGPQGDVKTSLGDALKAAGFGTTNRRIIAKPASTDELAKQLGALAPASKPSIIVPAKRSTHEAVTIYVTKECIPGDETNTEYLCVVRTRISPETGEITPDEKQNFGFDKSWSYYHGPKTADKKPLDQEVWKKKRIQREVPCKGTFWCTYVPTNSATQLLEGLRANFPGATLEIEGKRHAL